MTTESLKEGARKHEQNEEWIKALELYLQAIEEHEEGEEPDIALHNRVGDLQVRMGDVEGAVASYETAIHLYVEADLLNNAIAICRKIIRNTPNRPAPFLRMGQIRARQGFLVDARQNFLTYAEMMEGRGKTDEALRALEEFVGLSPKDIDTRLFLAEHLVTKNRGEEAVRYLHEAHRSAIEAGDASKGEEILDRIREIAPAQAVSPPQNEALDHEEESEGAADEFGGFETTSYATYEPAVVEPDPSSPMDGGGFEFNDLSLSDSEEEAAAASSGFELPDLDRAEDFVSGSSVEESAIEEDEAEEDDSPLPFIEFGSLEREEPEDIEDSGFDLPLLDALPASDAEDDEEEESSAPEVEGSIEFLSGTEPHSEDSDFVMDSPSSGEVPEGLEFTRSFELSSPLDSETESSKDSETESEPFVDDDGVFEAERIERVDSSSEAASSPESEEDASALEEADSEEEVEPSVPVSSEASPPPPVFEAPSSLDPPPATPPAPPPAPAAPADGPTAPLPPPVAPVSPPKAPVSEEYVDLGAMVLDDTKEGSTRWVVSAADPSGDESADFSLLLSQFKEQVARNLSVDDSEAHYDLGTAYKEMGLIDEAISEFQLALRAKPRSLATFEMLGQCFLERGEPTAAIRTLERGLQLPSYVEDDLLGIYYFLAKSHEVVGNSASARDFYERIFALDINFKDVTERLRSLR